MAHAATHFNTLPSQLPSSPAPPGSAPVTGDNIPLGLVGEVASRVPTRANVTAAASAAARAAASRLSAEDAVATTAVITTAASSESSSSPSSFHTSVTPAAPVTAPKPIQVPEATENSNLLPNTEPFLDMAPSGAPNAVQPGLSPDVTGEDSSMTPVDAITLTTTATNNFVVDNPSKVKPTSGILTSENLSQNNSHLSVLNDSAQIKKNVNSPIESTGKKRRIGEVSDQNHCSIEPSLISLTNALITKEPEVQTGLSDSAEEEQLPTAKRSKRLSNQLSPQVVHQLPMTEAVYEADNGITKCRVKVQKSGNTNINDHDDAKEEILKWEKIKKPKENCQPTCEVRKHNNLMKVDSRDKPKFLNEGIDYQEQRQILEDIKKDNMEEKDESVRGVELNCLSQSPVAVGKSPSHDVDDITDVKLEAETCPFGAVETVAVTNIKTQAEMKLDRYETAVLSTTSEIDSVTKALPESSGKSEPLFFNICYSEI
ncbi:unnamed protein product [Protopolystoma xenopodis]|uniref:Uncharacterized protein n=1 Tax=Protopolystoma xenopodis TaxID=117903 RepID=A0A3S5B5F5_9PLAT|nr:unnamed protein product [Protopolystoma xenopodis]